VPGDSASARNDFLQWTQTRSWGDVATMP
jgi:hypothetical protein